MPRPLSYEQPLRSAVVCPTCICGSGDALGSRTVASEEVDRAFGMPVGKLRCRAGIESLAYVADGENELSLGRAAALEALEHAAAEAHEIDWIIASSETHHNYPSLAAQLHSALRVREECGALDVGGGCLGLLNALAVAQSILASGRGHQALVVTADVHSRALTPGRVAGEFGGLFGDGASAFLVGRADGGQQESYTLGEFVFGCLGKYANAISVSDDLDGGLDLQFDGEALSRVAITRIDKVIATLEAHSGIARAGVGAFATHQPNPRLVALVAKQSGVSPALFPEVARTSGNLGTSTCGAALHRALRLAASLSPSLRLPIFLASLGPGLLFGGGWLVPQMP
jgi:3-oxoacyl-[acyl-carrier-protein] synthase-3